MLSARNVERLEALASELHEAQVLAMDVTDPESVSIAAQKVSEFDGIIYNAGAYDPIPATEWKPDAVRQMAEVNFTGALNVLGEVVPGMVARGRGHIVLIGSLAGFRGLPGAIGYGASKAALMHLAENLRIDLREKGITVQRINPGFIATRLTAKNEFRMPQLMEPEDAAIRVLRAMRSGRFSTSFPAPFSWLFTLGQHLPIGVFQKLF